MRIELLWFDGCPNREEARIALVGVLRSRGVDASIIRSVRVDAGSVDKRRFPGSPTIRVNGRDIDPNYKDVGDYSMSCRVYHTRRGIASLPETAWLEAAIDEALSSAAREAP